MMTTAVKDHVYDKVIEIEKEIKKLVDSGLHASGNLAGGSLGAAVFYFHLYKLTGEEKHLSILYEILENTFKAYRFNPTWYSYCSGSAGLLWTVDYFIKHEVLDETAYDAVSGLEPFLYEMMITDLDNGFYDFLHNGLGVLYTFLSVDRLKYVDKQAIIPEAIRRVDKIGIRENKFVRWPDVDFVKGNINMDKVNIGMAHGIPGIISILAKAGAICSDPVAKEEIINLTEGGAGYVYSVRSEKPDSLALYPYGFTLNQEVEYLSRLAWCYGDLGVALSYWHVYAMDNNELWKDRSLALMNHSARRHSVQENSIKDAGFCHGTTGIAHIFKKFFYRTGNPVYKEVSDYWIRKTLDFAVFEDGLAGYKYLHGKKGYVHNYGLLEGIIGTGLVLISSLSEEEYDWDKIWLVS